MGMVKNRCGQSGHGTLKMAASQEWIDGMNWCWCKFRKAKSYFSDFWVGVVKNGLPHLVQETLKSAVFLEWVYKLSLFFACWLQCNNFWLDWHCTLHFWLLNASLVQLYLLAYSTSLTFKCQCAVFVLVGLSEIGSVYPLIKLSARVFSWYWIIRLPWTSAWC